MRQIKSVALARTEGIDPRQFRAALRVANLPWHLHGEPWTVEEGSPEHQAMRSILAVLKTRQSGVAQSDRLVWRRDCRKVLIDK
jgi:hypothetical protein